PPTRHSHEAGLRGRRATRNSTRPAHAAVAVVGYRDAYRGAEEEQVSIYKRPESSRYVVEIRWRGVPRMKLSTGTNSKTRAGAMERTLQGLRDAGRLDVLRLLAEGKLALADVHEDYQRDPAALQQRVAKVVSPILGPLVDEWLTWLASPAALSSKTRRPFSPRTAYRYCESWQRLFRVLPQGRDATLGD